MPTLSPRQQAQITHPTYRVYREVWDALRHVREGTGGFLDGTYLVPHPREWADHNQPVPRVPTKKLIARRDLACYENFAATLLETMGGTLFNQPPTRQIGKDGNASSPITAWWADVDGAGTAINDFLPVAWDLAATFGHVVLYLDTSPDGGAPFVRVYTPLDVLDWLEDERGALTAIKLAELAPRTTLEGAYLPSARYRVVTDESWTVYDAKGARQSTGDHGMGVLPVVVLYGERRRLEPHIGRSLLGDPKLYLDLYNITSEIRELLRNQTFGILNVPLGIGEGAMSVQDASQAMGNATGTENILFSGLAAGFIQPDAANVQVYHEEFQRRLRTIYRLASLAWEADSKDAEATGSLKIKRTDLEMRLSRYADECERVEVALAQLFYRATFGPDLGVTRFRADAVRIAYPERFDLTPFDELVAQFESAQVMSLPAVVLRLLRKQAVGKLDGLADLTPAQRDEIYAAIDAMPDDPTPEQQRQERLAALERGLTEVA